MKKQAEKSITKEQLVKKVKQNPDLLTELLDEISAPKPVIRFVYG